MNSPNKSPAQTNSAAPSPAHEDEVLVPHTPTSVSLFSLTPQEAAEAEERARAAVLAENDEKMARIAAAKVTAAAEEQARKEETEAQFLREANATRQRWWKHDMIFVGMPVTHAKRGTGIVVVCELEGLERVHVKFVAGDVHRYKKSSWRKMFVSSAQMNQRSRKLDAIEKAQTKRIISAEELDYSWLLKPISKAEVAEDALYRQKQLLVSRRRGEEKERVLARRATVRIQMTNGGDAGMVAALAAANAALDVSPSSPSHSLWGHTSPTHTPDASPRDRSPRDSSPRGSRTPTPRDVTPRGSRQRVSIMDGGGAQMLRQRGRSGSRGGGLASAGLRALSGAVMAGGGGGDERRVSAFPGLAGVVN